MSKWTNTNAGKIQCNRFNEAWGKLCTEHNTHVEQWGIVGGEEHSSTYVSLFGIGNREDVTAVQQQIGEKYQWTLTADNTKQVCADILAALPALAANRPVADKRKTAEQDAADRAESKALADKHEAERAAKAAADRKQSVELLEQYPFLRPLAGSSSTPWALGAANIRVWLAREFPGHAFTVRSDSGSMTSSIYVTWTDGPTKAEVDAIADRFQKCDFNGMDDSESYRNDVLTEVFGGAKYVSCSRAITPEKYEDAIEEFGWADKVIVKTDSEGRGHVEHATGSWDNAAQADIRHIEQKVRETSYYTKPEPGTYTTSPSEGSQTAGSGVTVRLNEEHQGVEIHFAAKPGADKLATLKAHGWRWSKFAKVWYKKQGPGVHAWALQFAGVTPCGYQVGISQCSRPVTEGRQEADCAHCDSGTAQASAAIAATEAQ